MKKQSITLLFIALSFVIGPNVKSQEVKTKEQSYVYVYEKADSLSVVISILQPGTKVLIGEKTGDFLNVTISEGNIKGFVLGQIKEGKLVDNANHSFSQEDNLEKIRQFYAGKAAGDELISAGKLVLTGIVVSVGGSIATSIWGLNAETTKELKTVTYFGIGVGVTALLFEIAGFSKLIKAGKKFNIGATPGGFGMTINLNKL